MLLSVSGQSVPSARRRTAALVAAGLIGSTFVSVAGAQAEPAPGVRIEIAAQPLGHALAELARQTGTTLVAAPELLEGHPAAALTGELPVREAYARLLAPAGLEAAFDGKVVTVRRRSAPGGGAGTGAPAGATVLPAVTVVGATVAPTGSEGTGAYTTRRTTSSTGLDLAPREIPQTVSVVTRQQMADQGLTQLTEAVTQAAGLNLSQAGNMGSDNSPIYSRGFEVDNYLVDGVKMLGSYSSIFQSQDTVLYDRIEILRGAGGLMIGSGAPGATINLIRRRPTRDFEAEATLTVGSWRYRRLDLDVSSPLNEAGTIRGRLLGSIQDAGSYIDRFEEDRKVIGAIVEADLTPTTLLRLGANHQRHDSTGHSRGGPPAYFSDGSRAVWSPSRSAAASWAYSRRHASSVYAQLEQGLGADWKLDATLSRLWTDSDELVGYLGGNPDRQTGAGARIWATHWVYKPVQDVADLTASGGFDLFGRRHELATGFTLARSRQDHDPHFTNWTHEGWDGMVPDVFTWDGTYPTQPPNPTVGWGDMTEHSYSAFASLRLRPTDALSVIVGTRFVNWGRDETSYRYATGETERTIQKESNRFVPYIGITHELSRHWSAYASYTSIFQPQSSMTTTGEQIKPVLGNSRELGLKAAFNDNRLNLTFALYEIHESNRAVAIPDVYAPNGQQAYQALDGTKSRGFEVEVAGEIRPGWQLIGSFSRNITRDREGEPLLTEVPQNAFKVFTTMLLPSVGNGLTVGGGMRWQSRIWTDDLGPARVRFEQPSYGVVELMARYPINNRVTAKIQLWNALDKVYYATTGNTYYGEPRHVRASLSVRF